MEAWELKEYLISITHLYILLYIFLASGPMIETTMRWKALSTFGDTKLTTTICYCLNFQQGMKKDEISRPKLISPKDITGKTKIYNGVCGN